MKPENGGGVVWLAAPKRGRSPPCFCQGSGAAAAQMDRGSPEGGRGSRRGVSRLLSEVLMVSVVMSIGSLVYVYSVSVASEAYHPDISVTAADAVRWSGGIIVQATVRNVGAVPLKLTSATATGDGEQRTWNAGAELNVGHEYPLRLTMGPCGVGATVTLIVSAVDSRGAEVKAAASVTVRQP